jgi:hypothetical protein
MRMLLNAKRNRKYPNISVDDKVRVYKKKKLMDKERVPVFSKVLHTVEKIIEEDGQTLYKISGYDKPFVRSEIILVND